MVYLYIRYYPILMILFSYPHIQSWVFPRFSTQIFWQAVNMAHEDDALDCLEEAP